MIFLSLWWPTASSVFTRVNFSLHSSVSNVVGKDLFIFVILEIWNPQHIPNCVTRPVCYMKSVLLRLQSNFYLVLLTSKRLFSLHFLTNNEVNSSSSTTLSLLLFLLFLLFLWLAKIDYSDLTLKLVSFSTIWMEDWLCLKQKKKLQAIISNIEKKPILMCSLKYCHVFHLVIEAIWFGKCMLRDPWGRNNWLC